MNYQSVIKSLEFLELQNEFYSYDRFSKDSKSHFFHYF